MVTKVIKRNGKKVKFNKKKIENAILKSFDMFDDVNDSSKELANKIATSIENSPQEILTVEEIQDMVENKLMASSKKNVAKAYIKYRYLRSQARTQYDELWQALSEKLGAKHVVNQNANVDEHSFGGRIGEASSVMTKKYALDFIVSPMARENHLNNRIYIHDLDAYAVGSHNCLSIPFDKLLAEGFNTRQTDVRPAQSVNTAMQLVAVIFQLQSLQQFGGVSATHLDWTMVPYVRKSFYKHYKDGLKYCEGFKEESVTGKFKLLSNRSVSEVLSDLHIDESTSIEAESYKEWQKSYHYAFDQTTKEIYQACEGLFHNLNTLQSRSGNQLPFTSINFGTCIQEEGRLVSKALLEISIKGLGKLHKTSIFPCSIFQYMKGINDIPGTPNYDLYQLALESTSKRLYPNYANVDWSGNAGYDVNDPKTYFSTMGCRTVNGADINAEPGVNPQTKDGRGNICPVTIIMPTLAMEAKEANPEDPVSAFMDILNKAIFDAKDMLIERFDWICSQSADSAKFMYENGTMGGYKPQEGIRSALKHGTLVIGQLGLAETLQILVGCDHTTSKGMELAKKIESLFKKRCAEFKRENKLNFGVYYTPAENLCYTAMKKFQAKYGKIENVSDHDYFTNSIHVPVWHKLTPFEKIDIESQLTGYSNAGCITYVELDGDVKHNTEALEEIVNYAMEKDVPYLAINVPNDQCQDCGYLGIIDKDCPICGSSNIQRLRRVTGYLTGNYTTAFNDGKIAETNDRVKHNGMMLAEEVEKLLQ